MATNFQIEVEGLEELQRDMLRASAIAPKEMNRALNRIGRKFRTNMKKRAEGAYQTTQHITSGLSMSPVKVENYVMYTYFQPEKRGNKAHHWHLQEEGYDLTTPRWHSRKNAIRNKDGGKRIRFIPGRHLVDQEVPGFTEYMTREAYKVVDEILKGNDL